jgi:UDP-glucose 4-epimerase
MRVVITGGAGFIGSHLVEVLALDGANVTVLDHTLRDEAWRLDQTNLTYHCADIRDPVVVRDAVHNCNVVFHLAGLLGTDTLVDTPREALMTNVVGTLNVLDAVRATGATMVNVSLLPDWNNTYMITKQAASKFCMMYSKELSVRVVDLQLTHIYGPQQLWTPVRKAIPSIIRSAILGEPIEIYGSGMQPMDLLHVDDAARAICSAGAEASAVGKRIEVGSGNTLALNTVVDIILELTHSNSKVKYVGRRPGEPEDLGMFRGAAIEQQRDTLRLEPRIELRSGLERTIHWMDNYLSKGY